MTMAKPRKIAAGDFKSRCLALLDDVAETGSELVITKRGRPVARVVPIDDTVRDSLYRSVIHGDDIVGPIDAEWEATR